MDSSWKSKRQKCGTAKNTLLGTYRYFLGGLLTDNFCTSDYITSVVNLTTRGVGWTLFRFQVTGSHCVATNTSLQWQTTAWRPANSPILNQIHRVQLSQLSRSNDQGIYRTKIFIAGSSGTRHCTLSSSCPYTSFIIHASLGIPCDFSNFRFSHQNFVPSSHIPCVIHRILIPKRVIVKALVKTPM